MANQVERVKSYLKKEYGVEGEYLWEKYPSYAAFRNPDNKKWFAVLMDVPKDKLDLDGDGVVTIINVKSDPEVIKDLVGKDGIVHAYYLDKKYWMGLVLNDTLPDDRIFELLDTSYDFVSPKKKRSEKEMTLEEAYEIVMEDLQYMQEYTSDQRERAEMIKSRIGAADDKIAQSKKKIVERISKSYGAANTDTSYSGIENTPLSKNLSRRDREWMNRPNTVNPKKTSRRMSASIEAQRRREAAIDRKLAKAG